ncbi:MAG: trypsin-like peptidase domain-containing protein [Candidatus Paceibacterota bacterium]|jgi:hypothetical protein
MFCKNCGQEINSNASFCKNCGVKIKSLDNFTIIKNNINLFLKEKTTIIALAVIILLLLIVMAIVSVNFTKTNNQILINPSLQEEIARSVVNIFCPSVLDDEGGYSGSGTIIDESGIILTNSHIIPQDDTYLYIDDNGCVVILPDPVTGQPGEVYWANPIVIPDLSKKYDLAYMEIYAPYYDEVQGEYLGTHLKLFPSFDDSERCIDENIKLGEPVRIFGYPAISGGYSLTITDGVVSSFPGNGLIITSAKISYGNSGGLAVDRNGCMIGIPSMVSFDEAESLGVIISTDLISQFADELDKYIEAPDY